MAEFDSAVYALGDLANDPRVAPVLHHDGRWIEFNAIEVPDGFSSGELAMINLARTLYSGDDYASLIEIMASVDDVTWARAIEAITMRRAVNL